MTYEEVEDTVFRLEAKLERQGLDPDKGFDPSCSEADKRHLAAHGGFPIPPKLMEAYAIAANMERLMK